MSCALCNASALSDRVFFRRHGWFALLETNPLVPGHTILVRETAGACPDALTVDSLANVHLVAPEIAAVLKEVYAATNVLVTSLRGLVAHMHVHLLPLTAEAERSWRAESGWATGHLHQFLGDQDRASSIRNLQERIEQGWSEVDQRSAHTQQLSDSVGHLRVRLGWRAAVESGLQNVPSDEFLIPPS
jgi:diadenosine tetraphosphate (Ap4A) HIT family hydrolase